MAVRWRGAEEDFPRNRAGVQLGERVDPAVKRLVSFAGRLEPVAHRMAAHGTCAAILARELVEKFLLIVDRGPHLSLVHSLKPCAAKPGQNRRRIQFNPSIAGWFSTLTESLDPPARAHSVES